MKSTTKKALEAQRAADAQKRQAELDPTAFNSFDEYLAAVKKNQGRSNLPDRVVKTFRDKYNAAQPKQTPTPTPTTPTPSTPTASKPTTQVKDTPNTVSGGVTQAPPSKFPTYTMTGGQQVGAEGSFELKSQVADPQAWARAMKDQVAIWRSESSPDSRFNNKLDYIQALVRATGSGGVSTRGVLDSSDLTYIKDIAKQALVNGATFESLLLNKYKDAQSRGGALGGTASFSKSIQSAVSLLDQGDAVEKFSDAYYNAYGSWPTMAQTTSFRNYWNATAKRQMATTETTTVSGGSKPLVGAAKGGTTRTTTVTTGQGFTEAEQADTLATYLATQFGSAVKDVKDLGGKSLAVYNQLVNVYRSNYQEVPSFKDLAPAIADLVGTAEQDTFAVKLDNYAKKIRSTASFAFPAAAQYLNEGNNLDGIGSSRMQTLATKWGLSVDAIKYDPEAQKLIKDSFNYKDTPTAAPRIANDSEFNTMIYQTSRYQGGPEARNWFSTTADKLLSVIGRG